MAGEQTCDVDSLIEGERPGWPQMSVALWLCTLMAIEGYDMQTLTFAAPAILRAWHVSRADFGFVLSAHLVGFLFGALILGFLGDRLGRKKIILAGVCIFGACTFGAGFAASPLALSVLRMSAGFGLGGAIPIGIALAVEYMPVRFRATAIGLMYVAYNVGSAIGGFVAAQTIETFGWPSVFFIGGAASIPMLIGLGIALPESVRFLILKGGAEGRVLRIVRWLRPEREFSGATRFAVGEEHGRNTPASLFTHGRALVTVLLWLAFVASLLGQYFLTSWMPTVLSDAGLSISDAARTAGLFQFGGAVGSFVVAVLLDRRGITIIAVSFLAAIPFVAALGFFSQYSPLLVVIVLLAGFAVFGGQIGLNALSGTIYPTFMRGTGAGWASGVGRIGSISAPIIGGHLIGLGYSRPVLFTIAAAPLFCCGLLLFLLNAAMPILAKANDHAG